MSCQILTVDKKFIYILKNTFLTHFSQLLKMILIKIWTWYILPHHMFSPISRLCRGLKSYIAPFPTLEGIPRPLINLTKKSITTNMKIFFLKTTTKTCVWYNDWV